MEQEQILVIKHGALGDFVMAAGRMRHVRQIHPNAHIVLLTQRFLVEFAKGLGFFDEVLVDNRTYRFSDWRYVVVDVLAKRKWDRIYDFQSSNRTLVRYAVLARWLTRHPMKWGRAVKGGYDFHVTPAKRMLTWRRPTIEHLPLAKPQPDLSDCHGTHAHFDLLPSKYALLIPGCSVGNEQKRWPPERYRALSGWLAAKGLKSVVLGTGAEAREVNAICLDNPNAVSFLGKSSIADIPDLARGADVVVGNDTGPSHMARFSGAKTVMLFTDYDFGRAAPKDGSAICLHGVKISDIELAVVKKAVETYVG